MSTATLTADDLGRRSARLLRLACCTAAVVCAHTLLLGLPTRPAVASVASGARAVQLRTIAAASIAAAAPDRGPAPAPSRFTKTRRAALAPNPAAQIESASRADVAPVVEADPTWLAEGALALATPGGLDADYLPRAALTVAPRAQGPVLIGYPYFDGEGSSYAGEFELFIDDAGGVVRVQSAGVQLPKILVDAVRDAFLAARFDPGEVDGRRVRSRIRVEVTFDSQRDPF
jgi:hypothetical protein